MNCVCCGQEMIDDLTTFTVVKRGAVYITEDVPCWRCPVCEHVAFKQDVAKQLEKYSSGKSLPSKFYKAWVYKWGAPIMEIIPIDRPSSSQDFTFALKRDESKDISIPMTVNA
jgi:YgiT-type zinc finger domain-containing protein